jgi:hypothetical protein
MARHPFQQASLLGIVLWTVACSEPTIDVANIERSSARVRGALDERQRRSFDEALELIREVERGDIPGTDSVQIDGLTGPELLAEAKRIELRREIAAVEASIAAREEMLAEGDRLAELAISGLVLLAHDREAPRVTMRVRNGTGHQVGSGFVRLALETPHRAIHKTEEHVSFRPLLQPGQVRDAELPISRDFARLYFSTAEVRLTAQFTGFEAGGTELARELSQAELERARRALREAREELAQLNSRLTAI